MIEVKKETTVLLSGQFTYSDEDCGIIDKTLKSRTYCSVCHVALKVVYTYIITCLYESGLLSSEFDSLCCSCYMKRGMIKIEDLKIL